MMVEIGIGTEIDAIRQKFDSDPDFDLEQMERCCVATTRLINIVFAAVDGTGKDLWLSWTGLRAPPGRGNVSSLE
jgi:hypothetical protein